MKNLLISSSVIFLILFATALKAQQVISTISYSAPNCLKETEFCIRVVTAPSSSVFNFSISFDDDFELIDPGSFVQFLPSFLMTNGVPVIDNQTNNLCFTGHLLNPISTPFQVSIVNTSTSTTLFNGVISTQEFISIDGTSIFREDRDPVVSDYYAAICNADGLLQFYTNGCDIFGADHSILQGGSNINPGDYHDEWCFGYGAYNEYLQVSKFL